MQTSQQSSPTKEQTYPKKREWWSQSEVPYRFTVLLPRLLDKFGSVVLTASHDHLVFAMLATLWHLELT